MVSASIVKWIGIGLVAGLALLGALIFAAIRRGWMRNGYFTIVTTLLIVAGIFLVFQAIGGMLALAVGGLDMAGNNIEVLGANGLAQLAIMLVGTVVISRGAGQDPFAVFRLQGFRETPATAYILAFPIIISAQVAGISIASLWTQFLKLFPSFYHVFDKFESLSDEQIQGLVTAHNNWEFVLIFLFVAIIPALAEETLFRGFAQSNIERSGHGRARPVVALLLASLLFATIHLSLFKLPGLLMLGLALGWMAYRTNNLFVGSLGHAANNGLIVIALYLSPKLGVDTSNSTLVGNGNLAVSDALISLAESVPLLAVFVYMFHRVTARIDARDESKREIAEIAAQQMDHDDRYPDFLVSPNPQTRSNDPEHRHQDH